MRLFSQELTSMACMHAPVPCRIHIDILFFNCLKVYGEKCDVYNIPEGGVADDEMEDADDLVSGVYHVQ